MKKPYRECGRIRIFEPSVDSDELEWHVDFEDRIIEVVYSGGWKFQMDNQIPRLLEDGEYFFVKKFEWHRIIKGKYPLKIKVYKLL